MPFDPPFSGYIQPPGVPPDPTGDCWRGPPGPMGPPGPVGTGDASNTPVTATGSTTPRMLNERFADWLNIQDFGAAIDGTTSDTAAVNGALNAAKANGTIWFPYGGGNMVFSWLGVNGGPQTPLLWKIDGTLSSGVRINRGFQSRNNLGDVFENFYAGTKFLSAMSAKPDQPTILSVEYGSQVAGGSAGAIHTPIRVTATDNAGAVTSTWGLHVALTSNSNQPGWPQNVGVSSTLLKYGAAWCAGMHITASDRQNLPSSTGGTMLGMEIGYHTNAADDTLNGSAFGGVGTRMGLHLSLSEENASGVLPAEISFGILADGDANAIVKSPYAVGNAMRSYQVFDARGATAPTGYTDPVAAVRMLAGMCIDFNGGPALNSNAGNYLKYDSAAGKLYYVVAGVNKWSIDNSGNMRCAGTVTGSVTP